MNTPTPTEVADALRQLADQLDQVGDEAMRDPRIAADMQSLYLQVCAILAVLDAAEIVEGLLGDLPVLEQKLNATRPTGNYTVNAGTHVYVAYDRSGEVLYVGVSDDVFSRMNQHKRNSAWWSHMERITWEEWPDREIALIKEAVLIRRHRPPYNVVGNPDARLR